MEAAGYPQHTDPCDSRRKNASVNRACRRRNSRSEIATISRATALFSFPYFPDT